VSLPRPEYEAQIARNLQADRDAGRDRMLSLLRSALELVLSVAVGFGIMAFSVHTQDEVLGRQLFRIGQLAWIAGVVTTLLAAYRRGERRGDW
jgi:hypothetical protein